jgi:hypothetical protein
MLPATVALARRQSHNNADNRLQGGVIGADWDGGVDRLINLGVT